MNNIFTRSLAFVLFSVLVVNTAFAENMKQMGNLNVHYMAIDATFLTPEIAKTYGIERSRYNALVNISVLDNSQKGTPAKSIGIVGLAKNNLGQSKTLDFKEVREGDAIYYLAQIKFNNEETFHFDIDITDGGNTQKLKFTQKFYVD